jgi:AcrR family transcriptional regulator
MAKAAKNQLTKADWADAAMAAFEKGGIDAVLVLPLANALGVSRGSFYWHFRDRNALLLEVLARWSKTRTDDIIAAVEGGGGAPSSRLRQLLETCARDDGHLEMALRAWAQTDAAARRFVSAVDARRVNYLEALIAEATRQKSGTETKARIVYAAWLGEYASGSDEATRLADMRCLHEMLLTTR